MTNIEETLILPVSLNVFICALVEETQSASQDAIDRNGTWTSFVSACPVL